MKKILAFGFLILSAVLYFFLIAKHNPVTAPTHADKNSGEIVPTSQIKKTLLFVPYWSQESIDSGYNAYAYFGITANKDGIDKTEPGYAGLSAFTLKTENTKTLLVVRLLSGSETENILQDPRLQQKIIADSIATAKTYQFNGLILDLEYNGLAFPSVTKSLTDFSVNFAKEVHGSHLEYDDLVYGDTLYLDRPFNMRSIASFADNIFVMAYDFHKANGTPGPNFPYDTLPDADYNFQNMIEDFSKIVPKEKLTILFGMFGYDWTVDEKGRSIKEAESLTTMQMNKKFTTPCRLKDCKIISGHETEVTYIADDNEKHVVWFENNASVGYKKEFLQKNGIGSIGFWANGYF